MFSRPAGRSRLAAQRLDDGLFKLGRLGGFQHQRGHGRVAQLKRHLEAVGGVGVDHGGSLSSAGRIVARRSAWLLLPDTKP